jgi:benzoyl-CoA reductase subunit B
MTRSRKDLSSTQIATSYQREFGKTLQQRVAEQREPFAIAQADTAHEIFHTLEIPVVSNQ